MEREILEAKPIYEIRAMLAQRGAPWGKSEKKGDLIDRLVLLQNTAFPETKKDDEQEEKKDIKPASPKSKSDIEAILEPYAAHGLSFRIDEQNVHLNYGKLCDCVHITAPLEIIRRCAVALIGFKE